MRQTKNEILLANERAAALFRKTAHSSYVMRGERALLQAVAENKIYQNPTELWITNNASAKALLRHAGADEVFVDGPGSDFEKFRFFCTVLQQTAGNPLQLKCHAALQTLFECPLVLSEANCEKIWQTMCESLTKEDLTPLSYLQKCGVRTLLVGMKPWDTLEDFERVTALRAFPVFSPDVFFFPLRKDFAKAVHTLDAEIIDWHGFCAALEASLARFVAHGCRVATQSALPVEFVRPNEYHADLYFKKALAGEALTAKETALYQAQLWRVLGMAYAKHDVTLELCVGMPCEETDLPEEALSFSARAAKELWDYLKRNGALPHMALYAGRKDLIPPLAALAAAYPAGEDGRAKMALGVRGATPFEERAALQLLASHAPIGACVGVCRDARLYSTPLDPMLFHRTLCTLFDEWQTCGMLFADEEEVCRIITDLTGANMLRYYKL